MQELNPGEYTFNVPEESRNKFKNKNITISLQFFEFNDSDFLKQ
jgi:hypothetical protein